MKAILKRFLEAVQIAVDFVFGGEVLPRCEKKIVTTCFAACEKDEIKTLNPSILIE